MGDLNFKWEKMQELHTPEIANGDLRMVNLPVQVIFEWCDKIPVSGEYDIEPVFESGFIMRVLPNQVFTYAGYPTLFLGHTTK